MSVSFPLNNIEEKIEKMLMTFWWDMKAESRRGI
jgi:hypothetical protein